MPAHRTPPLSSSEIVAAAVAMTGEVGLDQLTMRSIATALDVTPMAVYHHVGDRQALVDLVADAVVAAVPLPPDDLPWQRWFAAFQEALEATLPAHPGVARHLLEHPSTPAGAAVRRRTVEVLVVQGFDERTALLAASTFHTHLLGRLALSVADGTSADEPAWAAQGLTAREYAAFALETLVAGIEAHRSPR